MSTVAKLQGGLSSNGNEAVLEEARKKLGQKKMSLSFLKTSDVVKENDGRIDGAKLAKYVSDIADKAYKWTLNTAQPFLRKLEKEIQEVGKEVLDDLCDDKTQMKGQRQSEYKSFIESLLAYCWENDETNKDAIGEELKVLSERRTFFEKMFGRISDATKLAILIDDLRNAGTKDELESLLSYEDVFVSNSKSPIRAFGRNYDLLSEAFGYFNEFAREKIAEVVVANSKELATAYKNGQERRKQEVFKPDDTTVSPEELLFGNSAETNEKTTVLSWKFQGHENRIKLSRLGDRLYVVEAEGSPLETLKAMREEWDEPFIPLRPLLAKDGEHLCLSEMADGKPRYDFGEFVNRNAFPLVCWIRTAAGNCIPSRLLPNDGTRTVTNAKPNGNGGKKPLTKPAGELLSDQEFLFVHWLGEYDLIFEVGFHYEPRNEEGKPMGETFNITERAIARLERKQVDEGKFKIALKSASSEELVRLLEASCAFVGHEFFEGTKGSSLPVALYLGIGQAFKRLKLSEQFAK